MSKTPLSIVILAAGMGTRMKSDKPKVMHELAGLPMINWLLRSCEALGPAKIIVVVGPDMPELEEAVKPYESVVQKDRLGTGDAVKAALPALEGFDGQVMILMGDEPLISVQTLEDLAAQDGLAALAFETSTPEGLGRVVLDDDGSLKEIVEEKDCDDNQKRISLCNAGTYVVPAGKLSDWVDQIGNDNAQGEYYLTDLPIIAAKDGAACQVVHSTWDGSWGVNTRVQLAAHEAMLQDILRAQFLNDGVAMQDPASVYFWHDTKIGSGTTLEPHVYFGADVTIESDVTIKAFSHIEGAHVKSGTSVGPFARLRPGANIGEGVRIGNFVEVKKSEIGAGSKINHLAYVGDCTMGENVNFSAGSITVNYDGYNKHPTVIKDNALVGSNVSLVAPVKVGEGALIAAGSVITDDVPSDALAIAREGTDIREGWAAEYHAEKKKA